MDFLIDRRLVIRCLMPIDKRNFTSALLVGVGPHFIHPLHLLEYQEAARYSMDTDPEFMMRNLQLLDEHIDRGLLQVPGSAPLVR
jgi:hypothetical protein